MCYLLNEVFSLPFLVPTSEGLSTNCQSKEGVANADQVCKLGLENVIDA